MGIYHPKRVFSQKRGKEKVIVKEFTNWLNVYKKMDTKIDLSCLLFLSIVYYHVLTPMEKKENSFRLKYQKFNYEK